MGCKGVVAVLCAITGSCLAFPGLRLGKMHWDAVRQNESHRLVQLLLNVAFIAPAVVSLLWVRPLARHYLVLLTWPSYDRPLLSTECFSIVRVVAVLMACALRLLVLPWYLEAYLDMAKTRLEQQRSHAGKINNKEIQRQVASVFYYLCVVTLQYLLPLLISCVLAIMLKTLGGLHWAALLEPRGFVSEECGVDEEQLFAGAGVSSPLAGAALSSLAASTETTQALSSGFDSFRKVMVPEMWRGLLGFWAWWSMFAWFLSGLLGLLYQKYFTVG